MCKAETMLIGSHHHVGHQHMAVDIAGNPLCHVTIAKYFGIYIDQHLTWLQRFDYTVSKARSQLCRIWCLQLSVYLLGLVYQAFIIPLFGYCDVVWTSCLVNC